MSAAAKRLNTLEVPGKKNNFNLKNSILFVNSINVAKN